MTRIWIWLAQGFGVGRIPKAPGTWGSLLGLGLALAALFFFFGHPALWPVTGVLILLSIPVCTAAEKALDQHDPGSVVLDEIWGMALVLLWQPWVLRLPGYILFAFALFRVFDIFKPPPLPWLAKAPAGWGIMLDDIGASVYAVAVLILTERALLPLING